MNSGFGAIIPATDLLDVFNSLSGSALFPGLTTGLDGQPSILGRIGWIFPSFGAVFVLWGFVLRTGHAQGRDKLDEIARTLLIIASILVSPQLMRIAMLGADGLYDSAIGSPQNLFLACIKAVHALPELGTLIDPQRHLPSVAASAGGSGSASAAGSASLVTQANDGTLLGYVESFGADLWRHASTLPVNPTASWSTVTKLMSLMNGFGSGMVRGLLIGITFGALYLLLLAAAAIVWFMVQLRYFLAVTGTMMLPLFLGLLSLPEGHPNRGTAHAYIMNLLSLALWPVAWTIGHTGTIALYDALISLVAATSHVSTLSDLLQWSSITSSGSISAAQVQSLELAFGNWLAGDLTPLLALVIGGLGFTLWVLMVSVLAPVCLHKLLSTGALFMNQAAAAVGRSGLEGLRMAGGLATKSAPTQRLGDRGGRDSGPLIGATSNRVGERMSDSAPSGPTPSPGGLTLAWVAMRAAPPVLPRWPGP